jgi:hypothetical protein
MVERLECTLEQIDLPMLIGEFQVTIDSALHVRNPIEPPGGYRDELERQWERCTDAFDGIFRHPGIAGYTLYKWGGQKPDEKKGMPLLRQANARAASIAAGRYPPRGPRGPLTGQVFISLQQGKVDVSELPAPDDSQPSGRLVKTDQLYLGLICEADTWQPGVYGNGIRGKVLSQQRTDSGWQLEIEMEAHEGMYCMAAASGAFTLTVGRDGDLLYGSFAGRYNGEPTEGKLMGHLHRPVTSTRV